MTLHVPQLTRRRAAGVVALAMAVAGVVIGGLWAWLAPPARGVIALTRSNDRVHAYLGAEADHFFVSAFLMLGMLAALAVVAAVAAWQWQAHRGPVMVAGLTLGGLAAAGAATGLGSLLVHRRYPVVDIDHAPVSPEHRVHYIVEAPSAFFGHTPLQIAATLVVPAAVAALTYALFAVSTPRDDLGAYPPVEGVVLGSGFIADAAGPVVP